LTILGGGDRAEEEDGWKKELGKGLIRGEKLYFKKVVGGSGRLAGLGINRRCEGGKGKSDSEKKRGY